MKRQRIWIVIAMIAFVVLSNFTKSDGIYDWLDFAESYQSTTFWYSSNDRLVIKYLDTSNSSVDVESPVIKDGEVEITSYLFNVSEDSRANANPVAVRCFYNINPSWNKFTVNLDMSSLNKSKTYYLYATPILYAWSGVNWPCSATDARNLLDVGIPWTESTANWEDPCVNINANVYWVWTYCEERSSSSNNSNSNNTNTNIYSISNISHICESNWTTTVTWQSYADVNVEILLRNDNKGSFEKIWTVFSERKSFNFTPKDDEWHFSLRFEPVDWSQKINYDWHCLTTASPEVKPVEPTNVKPVVVWPKENIMMIVFWTLILYVVYRVAARKRS